MFVNHFPETTFEVIDQFTSIADIDVTALQSVGESCSSGQEGHESHDDQDRILICTHDGNGGYYWRDSGRVMSR